MILLDGLQTVALRARQVIVGLVEIDLSNGVVSDHRAEQVHHERQHGHACPPAWDEENATNLFHGIKYSEDGAWLKPLMPRERGQARLGTKRVLVISA